MEGTGDEACQGGEMTPLLGELDRYYYDKAIHSMAFKCPHRDYCAPQFPFKLTEAKSSYVGPDYEKQAMPRLLFLSLDSGEECTLPEGRTPLAVRQRMLREPVRGRHWQRTHQLAAAILNRLSGQSEDQDLEVFTPRFAHVNSAKCCVSRNQAPRILFDNCRDYLKKEIEILKPGVVITQGLEAFRSFWEHFGETAQGNPTDLGKLNNEDRPQLRCEVPKRTEITCAGSRVLWLATFHPTYPVTADDWEQCKCACAEAVHQFFNGNGSGSGVH